MNNQIKYILNVLGTGILVIVLLAVIFFWADRLCDNAILDNVRSSDYRINISPSGLIKNEKQTIKEYSEKNKSYFASSITTSMKYDITWTLGLFMDIEKEIARTQNLTMMIAAYDVITDKTINTIKPVFSENRENQRIYFDKSKGLFVNCSLLHDPDNKDKWIKIINCYIGPEGIANEPKDELGRFIKPLNNEANFSHPAEKYVFYDKGLKRFFKIKITKDDKSVTKSPELDIEKYNPIQTGYNYIENSNIFVYNSFKEPEQIVEIDGKKKNVPIAEFFNPTSKKHLIVVNSNNTIDILNTQTLELKHAGNLPEYTKQQHGYFIRPVFFKDNYAGLMVSTIWSNLRGIETHVFDATGEKITRKSMALNEEDIPGGIASFLGRYMIESLQPAGFNILAYLAAPNFDGSKSQQEMFVRQNSNIAINTSIARWNNTPFLIELFQALIIMGPSLIIGILLGWRINKKAKSLGLNEQTIKFWTYGTIFTGIAGYITFMLTKPAEKMVTCKNCGQLRRVDLVYCQNCKADWKMKHLKKVDWQISS